MQPVGHPGFSNVQFVDFADMKADMNGEIHKIAAFFGIEPTSSVRENAAKLSELTTGIPARIRYAVRLCRSGPNAASSSASTSLACASERGARRIVIERGRLTRSAGIETTARHAYAAAR